jgi:hypothetical protein
MENKSDPAAPAPIPVDGWAVVMSDGGFVGIYRLRENAETLLKRAQAGAGERVRPMAFIDDIAHVESEELRTLRARCTVMAETNDELAAVIRKLRSRKK